MELVCRGPEGVGVAGSNRWEASWCGDGSWGVSSVVEFGGSGEGVGV